MPTSDRRSTATRSAAAPPAGTAAGTATLNGSKERKCLAALAGALSGYAVWARVVEDGPPFLRVSNPESVYAIEDIHCAPGRHRHIYRTSFGVDLGTSDDVTTAASRVAKLMGAA
jgi:hypothetical protein